MLIVHAKKYLLCCYGTFETTVHEMLLLLSFDSKTAINSDVP